MKRLELRNQIEGSVSILGSTVDLLPMDDVVARVDGWVAQRGPHCRRVVVTGFHGLWAASEDPVLQQILNGADLWVPDGIAPVWIARFRGHRGVCRIPGAELMEAVFRRGSDREYRHFFYGDTPETLAALAEAIQTRWPGNTVVGSISPPFRDLTEQELGAAISEINEADADFLWVGLGMPKQDIWIHRQVGRLQVPVAVGVGAAFAFVAGTVDRAPKWLGQIGLEWAYRLLREPRKCWRRCFVDGPQFLTRVALEQLRWKRR